MRNPTALLLMAEQLIADPKVRIAAPLACGQLADELMRHRAARAAALPEPPLPAINHGDAMAP